LAIFDEEPDIYENEEKNCFYSSFAKMLLRLSHLRGFEDSRCCMMGNSTLHVFF